MLDPLQGLGRPLVILLPVLDGGEVVIRRHGGAVRHQGLAVADVRGGPLPLRERAVPPADVVPVRLGQRRNAREKQHHYE